MNAVLHVFDVALESLRAIFLGAAIVAGGLCAVEWGVRTRRLNPFSALARTSRRLMSPVIKPVERSVVRAGGLPSSAPWWTLAGILVGGIVVLAGLEFVRGEVGRVAGAMSAGPRGIVRLLAGWVFALLYLALIVRVVSSWFRIGEFGRIVRWAYVITEPALAPLRRVLTFRMIDLSPIAAWFLLSWLIEPLVMRLL